MEPQLRHNQTRRNYKERTQYPIVIPPARSYWRCQTQQINSLLLVQACFTLCCGGQWVGTVPARIRC